VRGFLNEATESELKANFKSPARRLGQQSFT
jgi:hypothetical protein